jgi:hypothetical protein
VSWTAIGQFSSWYFPPSSAHSRLGVLLLPGNQLDTAQLHFMCVCLCTCEQACVAGLCVGVSLTFTVSMCVYDSMLLNECKFSLSLCVCMCGSVYIWQAEVAGCFLSNECKCVCVCVSPSYSKVNSSLVRKFHSTLLGRLGNRMAPFPE